MTVIKTGVTGREESYKNNTKSKSGQESMNINYFEGY